LAEFEKYQLVSKIAVVINRQFPDLYEQLSNLSDYRKRPQYEIKELIFSGLLMFLFKQKTRNDADNTAKNLDYQDNIKRIFGVRVADMDTVDLLLRKLDPTELEKIKQNMFRQLVKSKTLQKYKFGGKYFMLAIDGTGLQSFDYEPYPGCPFKQFKNKKVWTTYVLEAKIIASNGFSLSLSTEWVENPTDEKFNKQDCEFKAFKRMSEKLKKNFPRLPLMLLLDGLYPREPIFTICKNNNWRYAITLKDKSLKSIQEQIADRLLFKDYQTSNHTDADSTHWLKNDYKFFESVIYKEHSLYVLETLFKKEHKNNKKDIEKTRFVHVTDIKTSFKNVHNISKAGRWRWKIENEGFNNQKNNDYNMTHKFSRTNFNAAKNYYLLLQIADIINQLTYKSKVSIEFIKKQGLTTKSVISLIFSYLKGRLFEEVDLLQKITNKKVQFRY
jgi:hypothetical protein